MTTPEHVSLRQEAEKRLKKEHAAKGTSQIPDPKHPGSEAEYMNLIHELQVNQIELELQNEELRLAADRAEAATALYDFAPSGFFTLDSNGIICQLNLTAASMFSDDRASLIDSDFKQFVSQDDLPVFNTFLQKIFESNSRQSCEVKIDIKRNPSIIVRLEGIISENTQKCLVTAVDITERRQNEEALKNAKFKFKTIFDHASDGFLGAWVDTHKLSTANSKICQMLGYTEEELLKITTSDIHPKEMLPFVMDQFEKLSRKEISIARDIPLVKKDGTVFFTDVSASLIILDGKDYLLGLFRDVTERKQADEALRKSEESVREKLKAILSPEVDIGTLSLAEIIDVKAIQDIMDDFFNITHVGIGLIDLNNNVLVAKGWQDICTNFFRVHPETCRNCVESDTVLSELDSPENGKFKVYRCKNKMWDISTPIVVGGKHMGNIFLGQFFYDDETPDYEAFRKQARKYGFDEKEFMDAVDRVPRWSRAKVESVISFYSRFSNLISTLSYTNLKLAQTLNERKLAEDALKDHYTLLRIAGKAAKFGGWSLNIAENKVTWSDEVAAIHEMPSGYSPSLAEGINFYAPEWRDRITKVVSDCLKEGIPFDDELEIVTAKGNRVGVRAIGEAQRDKNGEIIKLQGAFQDISERKQAEKALKESEQKLKAVVNGSPIPQFVIDQNHTVVYWNNAMETLSGMKAEDIIGTKQNWVSFYGKARPSMADFLVDQNFEAISELYQGKYSKSKLVPDAYEATDFFPSFGAEGKWLHFTAGAIKDSTGNIIGAVETLEDISERKHAEEALAHEKVLIDAIFDSAPGLIYLYDMEGNLIRWNKKHMSLTGYTSEELVHFQLMDWYKGDIESQTAVAKGIETTIQNGFGTAEANLQKKDGTIIPMYLTASLLTIDDKQYFTGIGIDITDRKQAEEALHQNEIRLRELNATKDKFFSIIAHDLKNPFNSILGFSELLLEQVQVQDYEGLENYARIIQKSSEQAMDLVTNLLEWSRTLTGRMEYNPGYTEIVELINSVEGLLSSTALEKSITITNEIPRHIPAFVDKEMIGTVLRNLISNAIKFTKPGGSILVSAKQKRNELRISVTDNGVGIKKENIEKLFKIEENYSTIGTQNEKGTGLGLILCKEFIEKHGGKIWVESTPGKGSTFYFSVPGIKSGSLI